MELGMVGVPESADVHAVDGVEEVEVVGDTNTNAIASTVDGTTNLGLAGGVNLE